VEMARERGELQLQLAVAKASQVRCEDAHTETERREAELATVHAMEVRKGLDLQENLEEAEKRISLLEAESARASADAVRAWEDAATASEDAQRARSEITTAWVEEERGELQAALEVVSEKLKRLEHEKSITTGDASTAAASVEAHSVLLKQHTELVEHIEELKVGQMGIEELKADCDSWRASAFEGKDAVRQLSVKTSECYTLRILSAFELVFFVIFVMWQLQGARKLN